MVQPAYQQVDDQPKFSVTQNRRPWNKLAEELYAYARFLSTQTFQDIESIHEFKRLLLSRAIDFCRINRKSIDSVDIRTWGPNYGSENDCYCGFNRPNSTEGPAFVISIKKEAQTQ